MSFGIEKEISLTFINNRLFISRDDLVEALDETLTLAKDKQVHETIQNFIDGLNDITV